MIWLMITKNKGDRYWLIKPRSPCYRGEIGCCLFGLSFILGWSISNRGEQ